MYRLAISTDQIMPFWQRFICRTEHICACGRQPDIIFDFVRGEPETFWDDGTATAIIGTLTALQVQQFAGDIGRIDAACIFVLHLVEATFAASVAQGFPLRPIEACERRLPKGNFGHINGPIWPVQPLPNQVHLHWRGC